MFINITAYIDTFIHMYVEVYVHICIQELYDIQGNTEKYNFATLIAN